MNLETPYFVLNNKHSESNRFNVIVSVEGGQRNVLGHTMTDITALMYHLSKFPNFTNSADTPGIKMP